MKKLHFILVMLFTFSITYSQTTTSSNKAVFDGNNTTTVLELSDPSNGGQYSFSTLISGNSKMVIENLRDGNGIQRVSRTINVSGNSDLSLLSYFDGGSNKYYQLYHLNGDVYMALNKSNSKLFIGSDISYSTPHKLTVDSGSSYFDGNVGIGTENFIDTNDNNTEYRLSVGGKVRAEEVKVYTSWADFVFKDDYNLPLLKEVENYIIENGHLENIPSEVEVEENGINVGEMNKLLLQKIEELTLYTIKQQRLIENLQDDVKKLNDKL